VSHHPVDVCGCIPLLLIIFCGWFYANWNETGAGRVGTGNGVNDPLQVQVAVREGLGLFASAWCSSLANPADE
jgi:hypothetical protein